MNFELDPQQVLFHLREAGYHNVTQQQLNEFMIDLKRLIKHDITNKKQTKQNGEVIRTHCIAEESTSSTLPNTTDESTSPSPNHVPRIHCKRHSNHSGEQYNKHTVEVSRSSSESSIVPIRKVLRECTKHPAEKNLQNTNALKNKQDEACRVPSKPSKTCDCMWRRFGCKCCEDNWSKEQKSIKFAKSKENLVPPRPTSSFIRPRPGSAPKRSDPVNLYHKYQQIWKQQKLPGEDNHNDLRWTIRERMLGQEPNPRPLSQASSASSSVSRRSKRL